MSQFGGKDSKRHFTVVMGNKEHGLYVSSTPSSAARKAVTKLCAANKSKKVEFHIREITQGSKKKTYGPYEGYIEKLKEPIELKGRVIKYKPVAKLSGKTRKKTAAKKGGMRGGAKSIYKDESHNPKFRIVTDADLRKDYSFNIQKLIFDLFDSTKAFPFQSSDRKEISFKFRKDISDKIIKEFLDYQQKKSEILKNLKELKIPYEVEIYLDIPYSYDGEIMPRYEAHLYLKYTPEKELANTALPPRYNPANLKKYYLTLNKMSVNKIKTEEQLRQFFGKNKNTQITDLNLQNSNIQKNLRENYISMIRKGKPLNNPNSNIYEA